MYELEQQSIPLLVADDDADDRLLAKEALEEICLANDLHFVEDGQELMDYLRHQDIYGSPDLYPRPGLILLDLNLPRKDGYEALKEIKSDPDLHQIPVVIFTASKAQHNVYRSYDLGANSFVSKPTMFGELVVVMRCLGRYWAEIVELPPENSP